jgi:serine/threonine protein phosphatase 1
LVQRFAIGDIHGCYFTLRQLVEEKIKPSRDDEIYFLGDYIDRGPGSRLVIDYLIHLKREGYNIYPLMGNHEDMLLKSFSDERYLQVWFNNGAEETLKSFEVPEQVLFDYEALTFIPERYIHFISGLAYFFELDNFILVHAGLNFRNGMVFSDHESMLWSRDMQYVGSKIGDKTVIHGHTPMPLVSISNTVRKTQEKLINLDAGCVYKDLPGYGNLVGMDIDSRELFVQENVD